MTAKAQRPSLLLVAAVCWLSLRSYLGDVKQGIQGEEASGLMFCSLKSALRIPVHSPHMTFPHVSRTLAIQHHVQNSGTSCARFPPHATASPTPRSRWYSPVLALRALRTPTNNGSLALHGTFPPITNQSQRSRGRLIVYLHNLRDRA